jgi:gluconokinase
VYFGRMLDKIRLHAAGRLPADYVANLGDTQSTVFDARCCHFLGVKFADLQTRTLALAQEADEALLVWCHERGGRRTDEECEVWNCFMMKRGWRDAARVRLLQRIAESGFTDRTIETFFDYLDHDEGRDPVATQAWLK